jgi:hypothetical protein
MTTTNHRCANSYYWDSPDCEFYDNFIIYEKCVRGKTFDNEEHKDYVIEKFLKQKRIKEDKKPKKKKRR